MSTRRGAIVIMWMMASVLCTLALVAQLAHGQSYEEAIVMVYGNATDGSRSRGTGTIFIDDGENAVVATCAHVLDPFYDNGAKIVSVDIHPVGHTKPYRATVLKRGHFPNDISIMRFTHSQPVTAVELDSVPLTAGTRVEMIGYPTGQTWQRKVVGLVSNKVCNDGQIIVDAPVTDGMSGGPVFVGHKFAGILWGSGGPANDTTIRSTSHVEDMMNTQRHIYEQYCKGKFTTPVPRSFMPVAGFT